MVERKIIKFGTSSFVLTLPNEWVKKNKLVKGDTIDLVENQNKLMISTEKDNLIEKEAEINIDDMPLKIFNKKLISYYLKNYRYIRIKGEKVIERLEELRIFKEKLSSIEIYEIGKDFILFKDLSDPKSLDVDNMIQKIIGIEKILFDEIIENNRHNYISQIDSNINKLTFLTFKTINYNLDKREKTYEVKNSIYLWRIVSSLESIGDIIKRVARYLEKCEDKSSHIMEQMLRELKSYFEFITSLFKKDINLENNLKLYLDKKQSLLREFEENRIKFQDNMNLYLVVTQLLKDVLGELDTITLSIIDIYSE
ncbi:MAG: hypothetical protein PF569_06030 [Candidatus Woesearchaeota archaeon]|jgi:phosphate uptake regulator|nr:hypothetical protein [Candidatus Woesearchaeota archaeon]